MSILLRRSRRRFCARDGRVFWSFHNFDFAPRINFVQKNNIVTPFAPFVQPKLKLATAAGCWRKTTIRSANLVWHVSCSFDTIPARIFMNIQKFSATRYSKQSQQFSLSFDLLRHAVTELKGQGIRRFMEKMRLPEINKLNKANEALAKIEPDKSLVQWLAVRGKDRLKKKMSRDLPVSPTLRWAEYKGQARLALNSSELIIRIALFEALLKDIHRQALVAKPQLLSLCKPNRPVPMKNIFQGGFERFKFSEIDRQVREMDRLKTKEKAKFFRERLKLAWHRNLDEERDIVKRIDELINLRHILAHSDHSSPSAFVTDNDIKDARTLLKKVSEHCISAAIKNYPDYFS